MELVVDNIIEEVTLQKNFQIHKKMKLPTPTEAYDTYWRFTAERQNIFFRKIEGESFPWTDDEVLIKHKFTNAYRASDRVSQFLIKEVIYKGDQSPEEVFFRIILFKTFNKIETWKLLQKQLKEIRYSEFSFSKYSKILDQAIKKEKTIYSGAYIMTSGKSSFGYPKKHKNHLMLLDLMMKNQTYKLVRDAKSIQEVFYLLKEFPTIGDFLAYQYCIDLNYSNLIDFSEMDFVFPGPGARDGIRKCFSDMGDYNESEIIRLMAEKQNEEFKRLNIPFQNLWGRDLQLIDCQNLFCEVDKYSRVIHPNLKGISGRTRIKQIYKPTKSKIEYWYPPKWNINKIVKNYE
jgi:hypothetical protein